MKLGSKACLDYEVCPVWEESNSQVWEGTVTGQTLRVGSDAAVCGKIIAVNQAAKWFSYVHVVRATS